MEILKNISNLLVKGEDEEVLKLTSEAIQNNLSAEEILNDGLIAGMNIVGELFRKHEIFLPEVLLAAKAMYAGMEQLKPLLIKEGVPTLGKVVIGTVHGDLHDLGKNLVGIMLKGAGFEVIDLGKNVLPKDFVDTAEKEGANVIGMSALLTTTMSAMKEVVNIIEERGLKNKIKTVIGGAPITAEYAAEIGADSYAFDAGKSVYCVKQLLGISA